MANDLISIEREFQIPARVDAFADVLGSIMKPERLIRTVMISIERAPKILDCTRQSIINSAMSAAVLGLEVDGVTGQGFLIPYGNKCQLVIGYKGFNTIGARAGLTITGSVVREGDGFEFDTGEGYVSHKPSLDNPHSRRIIGAWAKAAANGRPSIVEVMGIGEIEAVKAKSPGAKKTDSPWNDPPVGFPAMASKTVKRRLARSTPLSVYNQGAALDEAAEERGRVAWFTPDRELHIEGGGIAEREPGPQPSAQDLLARKTPTEIIEELEAIARGDDGFEKLRQAWTLLPRSVQRTLGAEELARMKQIAQGASP